MRPSTFDSCIRRAALVCFVATAVITLSILAHFGGWLQASSIGSFSFHSCFSRGLLDGAPAPMGPASPTSPGLLRKWSEMNGFPHQVALILTGVLFLVSWCYSHFLLGANWLKASIPATFDSILKSDKAKVKKKAKKWHAYGNKTARRGPVTTQQADTRFDHHLSLLRETHKGG